VAHILLIEDDEALRALFCEVLETYGHSVTAAANGDDAIALFNDAIELVITDMNMPRKNGLQTAAVLRERAPNLPVITMSGHPGQSHELQKFGTERAANRFLYKPFTPQVLCDTVAQMLGEEPALA
jgi:two-component system response regulator FlrC